MSLCYYDDHFAKWGSQRHHYARTGDQGAEKGCVTMSITVPDSLSGARIFHLSMAPEAGWYIRRGHQSAKENILMTEDCFFQAIDCLA